MCKNSTQLNEQETLSLYITLKGMMEKKEKTQQQKIKNYREHKNCRKGPKLRNGITKNNGEKDKID